MKKTVINSVLIIIGIVIRRVRHYQTKYTEDGIKKVESWIQINLFDRTYCFSKRITEVS